MIQLGIDSATYLVYEARRAGSFFLAWPQPMLSAAVIVPTGKKVPALRDDLETANLVFREDSFDPVTRIRRGRFYTAAEGPRPSKENCHRDHFHKVLSYADQVELSLFKFDQYQGADKKGLAGKTVAIGSSDSLWSILNAERITTGDLLVTLKARNSLGVLPELSSIAVPEVGRDKAIETYEKLADAAYRESPGSIIDRVRDAAQWFLATKNAEKSKDTALLKKDLGDSITIYEKEAGANGPTVPTSAARVIARLHSRAKPNEQEKFSLRPVMESDAEFALAAVGLILRELGWAR